jgi:hypothetical protein
MKKRITLGLISLFLIGVALGAGFVYAQSSSQIPTITQGNYPGAPSYTVWTDGAGNYYAKNALGRIDFSGTNVATIINAIGTGNQISFSAGDYYVSAAIFLKSNVNIKGAGIGITRLIQSADISGILRGGSSFFSQATPSNITISDMTLIGQLGGSDSGNGIDFTSISGVVPSNIILENLALENFKNNAIYIYHGDNFKINKITIKGATQGIGVNGLTNSTLSDITINDCSSYGLDLSYARAIDVSNIQLSGENTAFKIDDGSSSSERSQYVNINNIYIFDSWGTYDSVGIWKSDHVNINNFHVFSGSDNNAVRLDDTANNITLSNGYIETTDASVVLALYNKAPQSTFNNIKIWHRNTLYWAFLDETTANNSIYNNIDTYISTLGIKLLSTNSHINLSWNSTAWIT